MSTAVQLAINYLNDRLVNADSIGCALDMAAGGNPPPWVEMYRSQLEGIREASEALESLLHGGCHD